MFIFAIKDIKFKHFDNLYLRHFSEKALNVISFSSDFRIELKFEIC